VPTVEFRGERVECERGAVLRDVLREAELDVHNGRAAALNCRGHGSCGTCAVEVDGETSAPTRRERLRLSTPPHDPDAGLRLACQTRVEGDLVVAKHPGFWGQRAEDAPE
jgi:ferredoxin